MSPRPAPDWKPLGVRFFSRAVEVVARDLLGRALVFEPEEGRRLALRIVETEAYLGARDRASHAWNGRRTERNRSLYEPPGTAYVYFIYGMHFCLNVVAGTENAGGAVLFRAGEPLQGAEAMAANRGLDRLPRPGDLAGGPGKLCRAMGLDRRHDGLILTGGALFLAAGRPVSEDDVAVGPRVGIDYAEEAVDWPLRFAIRGNPHVSRPRLV